MSKRVFTPNASLIEARKDNRMSQQDLAGRLGVSVSWVSKIEQGREYPSKALATNIAERLDKEPRDIFPELFEGK